MSKLMNLTGNIVDIFDLQKEDISAEVIILGACRINRFLGQTKYAYPVAAHLIGGYRYLEYIKASKTLMKQWLIHEAFESYSGVDLPSPLKAELPLYKEAERRALKVIAETFGVEPVESDEVKALDIAIMVSEALMLMPNNDYWWQFANEKGIEPIGGYAVVEPSLCADEKRLKGTLTSIWNKVFSDDELEKNIEICSSCKGEGEYEVSAGTHSFFTKCKCCTDK